MENNDCQGPKSPDRLLVAGGRWSVGSNSLPMDQSWRATFHPLIRAGWLRHRLASDLDLLENPCPRREATRVFGCLTMPPRSKVHVRRPFRKDSRRGAF